MSEKETGLVDRLREAAIYGPTPCPICDEAADAIERLQAELDRLHGAKFSDRSYTALKYRASSAEAELAKHTRELDEAEELLARSSRKGFALALRVKELEAALGYAIDHWIGPKSSEPMREALASTDKTTEEVINSWLGEPVVGVVLRNGMPTFIHPKNLLRTDTKLYAPRTEVKP